MKTEQDVIGELAKLVESSANEAIERDGQFTVGLSGGSLIKYLCNGLPGISTDWNKWKLFFCDERYVDDSDIDSTFGAYKDLLVKKVPQLKIDQFVKIDFNLDLDKCARDYEKKIRDAFGEVIISCECLFHKSKLGCFKYRFRGPPPPFLNLIYCCSAWAQMDTPVLCSPATVCSTKRNR